MSTKTIILVTPAPNSNRTSEENLGIGYLASMCRNNGFNVVIIDGWLKGLNPKQIVERIKLEEKPLFIGFSCYQLNRGAAIEVMNLLKNDGYDIPFVAGGFGPTFNAEEFLESGFNYVSIVEGEETLLNLCKHFSEGKPEISQISGLGYYESDKSVHIKKAKLITDLDKLPFPARDTMQYVMKERTPINFITSRGCTGHCLFCSVTSFWRLGEGSNWRGRSIENIVDELEILYNKGARHFKFVDDSFIEPPRDLEWCRRFADEIKSRGLDIRMRISIRADRINEGIIAELCRAGCNSIACGIENYSESALSRMVKKANPQQNIQALDILRKYNLYVQGGYILFDYATTLDELKINCEMMKKYSWIICKGVFSEMYAAKGTSYSEILYKKGIIKDANLYLENYCYEIQDSRAKLVYNALKKWHIKHMKTYDMTIDPISKPKALNDEGYQAFYQLYMEIRSKDLDFFDNVLHMVSDGISQTDLDKYVDASIISNTEWIKDFENKVQYLYNSEKIFYKAVLNPFYN